MFCLIEDGKMKLREPEVYEIMASSAYKKLYGQKPMISDQKWTLFKDTFIKLMQRKNES